MTNKEKYKQAFSVLRSSDDLVLEVEKMMTIKKRATIKAAAILTSACMLMAGGGSIAYAKDLGGIQRTIQLWIEGDLTDVTVTFKYDPTGSYEISYPGKDGTMHEFGGGGVAFEDDGTERPLTESELMEELNSPDVRYLEDGTVWIYYYDQEIEITDRFEDGVCYAKVSNGDETLYMTILYQDGWCSSPHKYLSPSNMR